jgi:hypothetical protein
MGSIPIARSTLCCLACPCVVLGRSSAHRAVTTVSTRVQPLPRSNASIGPRSISFSMASLVRHLPEGDTQSRW